MINKYFLSIFFLACLNLTAQQWTDPVVVSTTDGYNMRPDMVIDHNEIIHVVWSYKINDNFWKIYYSRSEDYGETWTEAYDVVQNTSLWMSQPHIVCDLENSLYVTYDYNTGNPVQMFVYLITYNDDQWSEPLLISEDMPGSSYNKVVVDNANRLYIFWNHNYKYYYKYLENGIWSDRFCPFCDYEGVYSLVDYSIDNQNNLHWIGGSWLNATDNTKLTYYFYNKYENNWNDPEIITTHNIKVGLDIDLDSYGLPHTAWREREQVPLPEHDYTFYKYFDGENWTEQEMVVEDPWEQQIAIDQYNKTHIVDREKTPTGWQLVHHQKINDEWIGYVIDTSDVVVARPYILFNNNMLPLVYDKTWEIGNNEFESDIFITKFDIQTNIFLHNHSPIIEVAISPNPFSTSTNIDFEVKEKCKVNLYIIDLKGELIKQLENGYLEKGNYNYQWKGNTQKGGKVKSGMYLCRLQMGRQIVTRSLQFIE